MTQELLIDEHIKSKILANQQDFIRTGQETCLIASDSPNFDQEKTYGVYAPGTGKPSIGIEATLVHSILGELYLDEPQVSIFASTKIEPGQKISQEWPLRDTLVGKHVFLVGSKVWNGVPDDTDQSLYVTWTLRGAKGEELNG